MEASNILRRVSMDGLPDRFAALMKCPLEPGA